MAEGVRMFNSDAAIAWQVELTIDATIESNIKRWSHSCEIGPSHIAIAVRKACSSDEQRDSLWDNKLCKICWGDSISRHRAIAGSNRQLP